MEWIKWEYCIGAYLQDWSIVIDRLSNDQSKPVGDSFKAMSRAVKTLGILRSAGVREDATNYGFVSEGTPQWQSIFTVPGIMEIDRSMKASAEADAFTAWHKARIVAETDWQDKNVFSPPDDLAAMNTCVAAGVLSPPARD